MSATAVTFDHYEVLLREDGSLFELGRGAMGITYKAFDSNLRIPVALKVINGTYLDSDVARQRFIREARAAAKLRHRHVASVFHLGTEGDTMFYAMEFIDGQTVEDLIKQRGPLAPNFALRIVDQVARALNAAQAHGLVHRDIKPANLMLLREDDEVTVKVIDFGLAKSAVAGEDEVAGLSLGGFIGTPHFASPEQLREEEIDVRSDIYSLGVTLWYMLAGRTPFAGSMAQVMSQHLDKVPPFERLANLADPVAVLLRQMLAKAASDRPQSAAQLRLQVAKTLRALGEQEDETSISAESFAEPPQRSLPPCQEASFELGAVIAGRYRLDENLGETNTGCLFRAEDLTNKGPICVLVLHSELTADATAYTQIEREVEKVGKITHPNLLRIYALETLESASIITMEWVQGFSLLEVLRARRELEAPEVLALLGQCAAGIDYALGAGLQRLNLDLHQVLIEFASPVAKNGLLVQSVLDWPNFTVKLNSLVTTHELSASETWAGAQTVVGGGATRAVDVADDTGQTIRELAGVVYELLGGSAAPTGSSTGMQGRYTPLASLSEQGNEVMRQAFSGQKVFATAGEFCTALATREGMGNRASTVPRSSAHRPSSSVRLAPAASSAGVELPAKQPPAFATQPSSPRNALPFLAGIAVLVVLALAASFWFFVLPDLRKKEVASAPPPPESNEAPQPESAVEETFVPPTPPAEPAPPTRQELLKVAVNAAEGLETEKDWVNAIESYLKIARDFPESDVGRVRLEMIITELWRGSDDSIQRDLAMLREPITEAAHLDVIGAMKFLGKALRNQEPASAFNWYAAAGARGDLESLTKEGLMLASGKGCEKDMAKATECFREAAEQGHPEALMALGECYLDGTYVEKDERRAAKLFLEAAEKGDLYAMNKLGECYHKGRGVLKSFERAARWFGDAAKGGYLGAYGNLGVLSMNGDGVPRDEKKAVEYFRKGVAGDDPTCMFYLARSLEFGRGIASNSIAAEDWYAKAAKAGNGAAQAWCKEHKIDFRDAL